MHVSAMKSVVSGFLTVCRKLYNRTFVNLERMVFELLPRIVFVCLFNSVSH